MQSLPPPPPPASLPPPGRRRIGRRINRGPAIIISVILAIVGLGVLYNEIQRAQNEANLRELAKAQSTGADPSAITKDMPSGYIKASQYERPQPQPKVEVEAVAPPRAKQEKKEEPVDDNGLEKARLAAWAQYWTNWQDVRNRRYEDRKKAFAEPNTEQPTTSKNNTKTAAAPAAAATPTVTPVSASAGAPNFAGWWGGGGGGYGGLPGFGGAFPGLGPTPQIDRQGQEQKIDFAGQQGDLGKDDIVPTLHKPPIPTALMAGSYIKVVAENTINSDVPGTAIGRVTESVYNTAGGQCVLVPQGSKVISHYNSVVSAGQTRLPGVMTRIIFPNGSSQAFGAMEVADNAGSAGWEDQIDRHLLLKFGSAAIAGMFGAAIQLSVPQNNGFNNGYNSQQIIGASIGQQMGQLGQQIAQQNLSIPNTLVIRAGYEYTIILDKDVIMQPWSCGGDRRASILPIMTVSE